MSLLCRLKLHHWTEDNKISRALMFVTTGHPFGCTRCGAVKDTDGAITPLNQLDLVNQ
jgi:hypothetical protein